MKTYPNNLQNGDAGDPAYINALKNAFLAHKARHESGGADELDVSNLKDALGKLGYRAIHVVVGETGKSIDYTSIQDAIDARMRVPKLVKNGFKSVLCS